MQSVARDWGSSDSYDEANSVTESQPRLWAAGLVWGRQNSGPFLDWCLVTFIP